MQRREPGYAPKMERFVKIVNSMKQLTIFAKCSFLELWLGSKKASVMVHTMWLISIIISSFLLPHFRPMFPNYIPWKHHKIEMKSLWHKQPVRVGDWTDENIPFSN